jgi:uncharacterized protein
MLGYAGIGGDTGLVDMDPDKIRKEVHINLIAMIECTQAVLPIMLRQQSGHIVNVASLADILLPLFQAKEI